MKKINLRISSLIKTWKLTYVFFWFQACRFNLMMFVCRRHDTGFWCFWYLFSLIRYIVHSRVPFVVDFSWKIDNHIMWTKHIVYNIVEKYIQWHERSYRRNNTAIFDFDRHVCAFSISIIVDRVISLKILIQSQCTYCKDSCFHSCHLES